MMSSGSLGIFFEVDMNYCLLKVFVDKEKKIYSLMLHSDKRNVTLFYLLKAKIL
jgi:hypothetical protein